jgi:hypothetical protein
VTKKPPAPAPTDVEGAGAQFGRQAYPNQNRAKNGKAVGWLAGKGAKKPRSALPPATSTWESADSSNTTEAAASKNPGSPP